MTKTGKVSKLGIPLGRPRSLPPEGEDLVHRLYVTEKKGPTATIGAIKALYGVVLHRNSVLVIAERVAERQAKQKTTLTVIESSTAEDEETPSLFAAVGGEVR